MTGPPPQACRPVYSPHVKMLPSSEKTDYAAEEEEDESFHDSTQIAARGLGGRCLAQRFDCQPAIWLWAWLEQLTVLRQQHAKSEGCCCKVPGWCVPCNGQDLQARETDTPQFRYRVRARGGGPLCTGTAHRGSGQPGHGREAQAQYQARWPLGSRDRPNEPKKVQKEMDRDGQGCAEFSQHLCGKTMRMSSLQLPSLSFDK